MSEHVAAKTSSRVRWKYCECGCKGYTLTLGPLQYWTEDILDGRSDKGDQRFQIYPEHNGEGQRLGDVSTLTEAVVIACKHAMPRLLEQRRQLNAAIASLNPEPQPFVPRTLDEILADPNFHLKTAANIFTFLHSVGRDCAAEISPRVWQCMSENIRDFPHGYDLWGLFFQFLQEAFPLSESTDRSPFHHAIIAAFKLGEEYQRCGQICGILTCYAQAHKLLSGEED